MFVISDLTAREILDSRGRPTLEATCTLHPGIRGTASVPSGASTGSAEALELRDGDPSRYRGLGCRKAAAQVNHPIRDAVRNREFNHQSALDESLLQLAQQHHHPMLGANAILAVSLAFARASAAALQIPLYQHFAAIAGLPLNALPRLTVNLFSGGKHAGGQAPIQDVLVVPISARSIDESLAMTFEIYQTAAECCARKYGTRLLRADEGGQAPPFPSAEAMIADALDAIERAGFKPRHDVALAVDVASSHFHRDGTYHLTQPPLPPEGMIRELERWVRDYPIVSIEDGLAEEDWDHWPALRQRMAGRALVVGDDFLCTHPDRIRRAIRSGAASALLLKVNQIGTLTQALEAAREARAAGWHITVSARSGETEDHWLADLAVGWSGNQIKVGSITQSERLAKYNRLLQIESETGLPLFEWSAAP